MLRSKRRLVIMLLVMIALLPVAIYRFHRLSISGDYAYTLSFGNGYGHTFYNEAYRKLPRGLQEAVEVHERVHLEQGTWKFWRENEMECLAYDAEIAFEDMRIAQCEAMFNKTHELRFARAYETFVRFQREARAMKKTYQETK